MKLAMICSSSRTALVLMPPMLTSPSADVSLLAPRPGPSTYGPPRHPTHVQPSFLK